jgi:hypothetical protein
MDSVILQLTACPDADCQLPAEVVDRFVLPSTEGPIEHVMLHCLARHTFTLPVARLITVDRVRS